jgi:hypothetical protein
MAIAGKLQLAARERAEGASHRASELERQIAELQFRRLQLDEQYSAADEARKRLANYEMKVGADYQCPCCWIDRGARAPLQEMPSGTDIELFRCTMCGWHMESD